MLRNAYFLAKIGADTAEHEQHFAEILPKLDLAHCPGERLDHHAEDNMNVLLEGFHGCWLSPIGLVSRHGACVARGVGLICSSKKAMAKQVTVTGKDGKAMNLEQVSLFQFLHSCGLEQQSVH